MINYTAVPAIYRHRLQNYFTKGTDPGPFLVAVLSGDLFSACRQAGDFDNNSMGCLAAWIYTEEEIPLDCWGSPEKVTAWTRVLTQSARARVAQLRPDVSGPTHPAHSVVPESDEPEPLDPA